MYFACLGSHWVEEGKAELPSDAVITHEPVADVAAAGHDRGIIKLCLVHLEACVKPCERRVWFFGEFAWRRVGRETVRFKIRSMQP